MLVAQRVVVHMSSLAEGTRFVRPLTANHLMGYHGMRKTNIPSIQDGRWSET